MGKPRSPRLLTDEALGMIARRFSLLAEPMRLRLLREFLGREPRQEFAVDPARRPCHEGGHPSTPGVRR